MLFEEVFNVASMMADTEYKKKSVSLEGCEIIKSASIKKRIFGYRCHHIVEIHDLIRKITTVAPQDFDVDIWKQGDIDKITLWLSGNCVGNYEMIIVPADGYDQYYHEGKKNRIRFNKIEDAMAFKLRWI